MIFAIIILGFSLFAMIAMISGRMYEINAGNKVFLVVTRTWFDKHLQNALRSLMVIVKVASTKKFWTGLSSYTWRKFVEKVWHHPQVKKATKKAVDVVRGKKEIKSNGPVSFYLKDVSDYKNDLPS